jgi:hypothetical protein
VPRLVALLSSLTGLAIAAGGCGAGSSASKPRDGSAEARPVREAQAAPRLAGRVLILCGHDDFAMGVHEIRSGIITERISPSAESGIHGFAIGDGKLAYTKFRDATDHVESMPLDAPLGTSGEIVARGTLPAINTDGTVAWTRLVEHADHYADAVYVRPPGQRARRVATYPHVWSQQFVDGKLHLIVSRRNEYAAVSSVRSSEARTVSLRMDNPGLAAWSPTGKLAYGNGRSNGNKIRIVSRDGRSIGSFATEWQPMAWSPDDRSLLVGNATSRIPQIGVLDSASGKVDDLGELPCGRVAAAQWLAE